MKHILSFALIALILSGCGDDEVGISSVNDDRAHIIDMAENIDKHSYEGLEHIFLDTKTIDMQKDKTTLLIFGKNNCPYCEKLKDDIKANKDLQNALKAHFLPYYINASYTKSHILHFADSTMLDTQALMERFVKSPLRPTPTLVFLDTNGAAMFELPGYLEPKYILAILDYIHKHPNAAPKTIASDINDMLNKLD